MLLFVDLSRTAIERHPGVLNFVKSWVAPVLGDYTVLVPKEWFREGHGIVSGKKDSTPTNFLNLSCRRKLNECAFLSRSCNVDFQFSRIG